MNSPTEHTCIKDDGGTPGRKCEACAAEPRRPTDTDLLDWLEREANVTRDRRPFFRFVFKRSFLSFGFTASIEPHAHPTVRAAIAAAMDEEKRNV